MDELLWTLCLFVIVVSGLILFYAFSTARLSTIQRPWRRRRCKSKIKSLRHYIDDKTGEFAFVKLLEDTGAPFEPLVSKTNCCLPRRGEFLVMDYSNYEDARGSYAIMNKLSWKRMRDPLELIFCKKKKIWVNDPRNVCRLFWIDGSSIDVGDQSLYLSYDAIHTVYGIITGLEGFNE